VVAPLAPTQGRADLARLRRTSEVEIARTSPPELRDIPDDFWRGARVVTPVTKEAISVRLDEDVMAWFRASGRNTVIERPWKRTPALYGRLRR
jgi:uncharacterized protein (DUF4415 family)